MKMKLSTSVCRPCWRPQLAGIGLGVAIVLAFYVAGRGVGATGGATQIIATLQNWILPHLTAGNSYLANYIASPTNPLGSFLVYLLGGMLAGSFFAALFSRHLRVEILRGPNIGVLPRLTIAFAGGVLVGYASRLARGCTSGQALVGGAELSVGAWVFMVCIFIGGFAAAWLVRKQWL
jgi:uncharacterized protein